MQEPKRPPAAPPAVRVRYHVLDQALGPVDRRLFGQFLERPSWGETGPEAAVINDRGDLQPAVVTMLDGMRIPIVRFPGGTDVDYMDWRDMIDNVPGRDAGRPVSTGHTGKPVTNRFGFDEYLRLAEKRGWESILVVNFREGQLGLKPLQEAARQAAGLIAYCNAKVGTALPDGMPDWPALRARNGRTAPYGVKYVQIGNETSVWGKEPRAKDPTAYDTRYVDSLEAYEKAIHAVDPAIQIIVDASRNTDAAVRARLGDRIAFLAMHIYMPWKCDPAERDGQPVRPDQLTPEEVWKAWVATPGFSAEDGLAVLPDRMGERTSKCGYKLAITEWNWNGGWWSKEAGKSPLDSDLARGVGAAGFVHALMRGGTNVAIATQSMLVGHRWGIAAIFMDPAGTRAPEQRFSGMVTALYGQHHGDTLMAMQSEGLPCYAQPLRLGGILPHPKVAMVDALSTAGNKAVFWHAINRGFEQEVAATVDLSALGPLARKGTLYLLEGHLENRPAQAGAPAWVRQEPVFLEGGVAVVHLPARCVAVLSVERQPPQETP